VTRSAREWIHHGCTETGRRGSPRSKRGEKLAGGVLEPSLFGRSVVGLLQGPFECIGLAFCCLQFLYGVSVLQLQGAALEGLDCQSDQFSLSPFDVENETTAGFEAGDFSAGPGIGQGRQKLDKAHVGLDQHFA